jgi:hypothetical protein
MFYEEFELFPNEEDPRAEYKTDDLKIFYYMPNIIESHGDLMDTITHEWLHGLFDWATEGAINKKDFIDADGEHFIMRLINWYD